MLYVLTPETPMLTMIHRYTTSGLSPGTFVVLLQNLCHLNHTLTVITWSPGRLMSLSNHVLSKHLVSAATASVMGQLPRITHALDVLHYVLEFSCLIKARWVVWSRHRDWPGQASHQLPLFNISNTDSTSLAPSPKSQDTWLVKTDGPSCQMSDTPLHQLPLSSRHTKLGWIPPHLAASLSRQGLSSPHTIAAIKIFTGWQNGGSYY